MNFTIRKAEITDAKAIWKLNTEEMGYDYPLEDTIRRMSLILPDDTHRIFVAESEGEVLGYVHAHNYEIIFLEPYKDIMSIAVSSEYKRNGIGRALLTEVEKWAKDTGAVGIMLVSGESRVKAHEFYRGCGYVSHKKQLNFQKIF